MLLIDALISNFYSVNKIIFQSVHINNLDKNNKFVKNSVKLIYRNSLKFLIPLNYRYSILK